MIKSLIRENIKEKLEKLNDDISYVVDGQKIDIIVNKVIKKGDGSLDDYSSEKYNEYTVIIDGQKILYKTYGYAGGGWRYWDKEEIYLGEAKIYNDMKSIDEKGPLYINGDYSIQDDKFWVTKYPQNVYNVSENLIIGPNDVYYKPKKDELGFTITKNVKKVARANEVVTFDSLKKIYDDYNSNGQQICDSILDLLKNSVNDNKILPIDDSKYKSLRKTLENILSIKVDEGYIKGIEDELKDIKKMKLIYDNIIQSKKALDKEIDSLNNILEKCLDMAISNEESYEKELEAAKLVLRKKYNKKTTV